MEVFLGVVPDGRVAFTYVFTHEPSEEEVAACRKHLASWLTLEEKRYECYDVGQVFPDPVNGYWSFLAVGRVRCTCGNDCYGDSNALEPPPVG